MSPFKLELRTTALTLEANDDNDLNAPVGIMLDETRLTITDYAIGKRDGENVHNCVLWPIR